MLKFIVSEYIEEGLKSILTLLMTSPTVKMRVRNRINATIGIVEVVT